MTPLLILSILFIWIEVYYVFNKQHIDSFSIKRDILSAKKLYYLYYLSRIIYFLWIIFGLFSDQRDLFIFLISLRLVSFPFYHLSKRLYVIWDNILPSISIIFTIIIFIYSIKG